MDDEANKIQRNNEMLKLLTRALKSLLKVENLTTTCVSGRQLST